ncbi:MAG TPA: hypothetical protein VJJ73_01735 [Candidatus Paceibacterota bacterium]
MGCPLLYIGQGVKGQEAVLLLKEAGFNVEVKIVPRYHEVAIWCGLPVLFGLSGKFEGIEGIRIFIENATKLGYANR